MMRFSRPLLQQQKITKVLVANRGEIACRVFKTARSMGLGTTAIYCDAEKNGKHVQSADEAFRVGPPPASSSYLQGEKIIDIAKSCGAQAIHPGYGFLSENEDFARKVQAAGLEFVGPPAEAIRAMGSKSESKNIMTKAKVPVVPGYHGEDQKEATLKAEAQKMGYPLLIKAVSGGGGKGMKIVRKDEEFDTLLASAKREAMNFFKDDRVLLERYIECPRHIECQVFCDKHGNGVYFFERDCSVQRRHQKVLEEAPAPGLSEELRKEIGETAVRAAKSVGYVGAGTVEFIFDTDNNDFFFMEMNTRLQVEHPVTEEVVLINGEPLDLVRLQINVAGGMKLPFTQADLKLHGHCIEARIFAESPKNNFLPGSGKLAYVQEPDAGMVGDVKIRVDTGFRSGDDVLVFYDPMIAKLIVWGPTREVALRGLRRALNDYHVVGIPTNIDFLKKCCDNEQFAGGAVTTKFIEEHKETLLVDEPMPSFRFALAAMAKALRDGKLHAGGAFRLNGVSSQKIALLNEDKSNLDVAVSWVKEGCYRLATANWTHDIELTKPAKAGNLAMYVDNTSRYEFSTIFTKKDVTLMDHAGTHVVGLRGIPDGFGDVSFSGASTGGKIMPPMPGKLGKYLVKDGSHVELGQNVLIMEAMKMEHIVTAPCAGTIKFHIVEGEMANDELLATVVPPKKQK